MAIEDLVVPLIQLIALFLPAWAVVMQIFLKIVSKMDFNENPTMIPFVAFGFFLAFASLYLFGYAGHEIMTYLLNELTNQSGPLSFAIIYVESGALAFVTLGAIVVLIAGFTSIEWPLNLYTIALTMFFGVIVWAGWTYRAPVAMMVLLLVSMIAVGLGFAYYYDPREGRVSLS